VVAVAIYCALLAPWWARNYALLGAFVPFGTSSTINLYTGNSPQNPNALIYGPNMPDDWDLDRGVSLLAIPGELERYRAFRDAAFRYIAEDPAAFFRRAWIKLKVFWSIVPNALDFQNPIYRIVGAISFGPVLALAILCVLLLRRRFADLLPIYVTIGYFTALYAITIASIRYRLPIEPLLIALASWPLTLAVRAVLGARETKTTPMG
jgi:hypothetical protein